jgi:hypothetical protein
MGQKSLYFNKKQVGFHAESCLFPGKKLPSCFIKAYLLCPDVNILYHHKAHKLSDFSISSENHDKTKVT